MAKGIASRSKDARGSWPDYYESKDITRGSWHRYKFIQGISRDATCPGTEFQSQKLSPRRSPKAADYDYGLHSATPKMSADQPFAAFHPQAASPTSTASYHPDTSHLQAAILAILPERTSARRTKRQKKRGAHRLIAVRLKGFPEV